MIAAYDKMKVNSNFNNNKKQKHYKVHEQAKQAAKNQ